MKSIKVTAARKQLYRLLAEVTLSSDPVQITGKRGNAVLLSEDDWLALQETVNLLSGERLDLLQSHAVLVNTARGGIVDEEALADRLAAGRFAGAGLDVYEHEPAIYPKLLLLDNVVLVPHLGSATFEGRNAMGGKVIDNITALAAGEELPDRL